MYELSFLRALGITIGIEVLIGFCVQLIWPSYFKAHVRAWQFYCSIAIATILTLPYVWFIIPYFVHERGRYALISESWAVFMEGFLYVLLLRFNFKRALIFSFVLNMASFFVGSVL